MWMHNGWERGNMKPVALLHSKHYLKKTKQGMSDSTISRPVIGWAKFPKAPNP